MEDTSQFNAEFIKSYSEECGEGYLLDFYIQYPEKLHELHSKLPSLPKIMRIEKKKSLLLIYIIKVNMLFT